MNIVEHAEKEVESQRMKVEQMRKDLARDNAKLFYGEMMARWKELQTEVKKLSKLQAGLDRCRK